jgi:hypothetical protein
MDLMMLTADEIRTFPCPQCNEIIATGAVSCPYCGAPIDASIAAALADRQSLRAKAFAGAHGLVITSRTFPIFFGVSFLPFVGVLGVIGVLFLLLRVPYEGVRWYLRYWRLEDPHPDIRQARSWFIQAWGIWGLAVLAVVVWIFYR